jgi:hypothetical protein
VIQTQDASDLASARAELASLQVNVRQLDRRLRLLEKMIDTRDSPWWLRLKWRVVDGYPPWYRVGPPRPFHQRVRELFQRGH